MRAVLLGWLGEMGGKMQKTALTAGILLSAIIFTGSDASAQGQKPVESNKKANIVLIKPGDTLEKIAKQYKTTYPRLFDANKNIKHPDVIYAGEKIRVPSASEKLARRTLDAGPSQAKATSSYKRSNNTVAAASSAGGGVWDKLAACESGGNWSISTGNGYYGGLQFSLSTWRAVGGSGYPHQASKAEQIKRGTILQQSSGWGQWPACSAKLGLI